MAGGEGLHSCRVAVNAAVVEVGPEQAALAEVFGADGGYQSFAGEVFHHFGVGAAVEAAMVGYQDVADQVGVVDQVEEGGLDGHCDQVAVGGGFLHQAQGVADIAQGLADEGPFRRAGGQVGAVDDGRRGICSGSGGHMVYGHSEASWGVGGRWFRLYGIGRHQVIRYGGCWGILTAGAGYAGGGVPAGWPGGAGGADGRGGVQKRRRIPACAGMTSKCRNDE